MKIELKNITIRELITDYEDNQDAGVVGFSGKLDIRPAYQREFVYKDKQRDAVIRTVRKNYPLNTMYWGHNGDDTYEVMDGQQRTISICQYVNGDFSIDHQYFKGLTKEEQEAILNYPLQVYFCDGTAKEKLEWFKTINIAGEKLTDQELLNINYTGTWLSDAKKKFSKNACVAYKLGSKYMKGTPIRQDYLEEVLDWISDGEIADYMALHQHDANANDLWVYYRTVINWVETLFPNYRKEMKGIHWGKLYNQYKDNSYDPDKLEAEIVKLMQDEDVTKKTGIYEYLLSNKTVEKALSIRAFTDNQKREAYERQGGVCPLCGKQMNIEDMEADHITPWSLGGKTTTDNLQMICKDCNRTKSNK